MRCGVGESGFLDGFSDKLPCISVWVLFVCLWEGDRVFLNQRVLGPIDHGVDAEAEEVLMVLRQDAGGDDIAPWTLLVLVDQRCGEDSGSPRLKIDGSALLEMPGKDVFVVADCDDVLND